MDDGEAEPAPAAREAIEQAGRVRLGELLRELPEIPGNPVVDMVAFNSARGVTAVDLRGLGSGNTLVLVNGRRTTVNANPWDLLTTYVGAFETDPHRLEEALGGLDPTALADPSQIQDLFGDPAYIECGHTFPVPLSDEERDELYHVVRTTLEMIGYRHGPCHTEVRRTESGWRIGNSSAVR